MRRFLSLTAAGVAALAILLGGAGRPWAGQAAAAADASGQGALSRQSVLATGIDVVTVVRTARPSVVNVLTGAVTADQFRQPVPTQTGAGTGVIFDTRGYILTNSHVVRAGGNTPASLIAVTLDDSRTVDATLVDDDPLNDLAILKVDAGALPAARLGDSDRLEVGEPVVAIGNALALPGGPTVSSGVVSAVGRSIDEPNGVTLPNLVQTDAAINPGNSGGPLLNAQGEVIGINTAGAQQAQGISFAVAINQAKPAIDSVIATGQVARPLLGVRILGTGTPAIARANGLSVTSGVAIEPSPGGPAAAAGVLSGDIVVAADDKPVRTVTDLTAAIRAHRPGEQLRLTIQRGSGPQQVLVATLADAASSAS